MADTQEDAHTHDPLDYRDQHVDKTLDDHEQRITKNERRWLMTKGALGMLAAMKGVDFAIGTFAGFL